VLTVYPAVSWAPRVRAHEFYYRVHEARIVQSTVLLSQLVHPSVRLSVCQSVRDVDVPWTCWVSSKVITRIISLGSSLLGATTSAV